MFNELVVNHLPEQVVLLQQNLKQVADYCENTFLQHGNQLREIVPKVEESLKHYRDLCGNMHGMMPNFHVLNARISNTAEFSAGPNQGDFAALQILVEQQGGEFRDFMEIAQKEYLPSKKTHDKLESRTLALEQRILEDNEFKARVQNSLQHIQQQIQQLSGNLSSSVERNKHEFILVDRELQILKDSIANLFDKSQKNANSASSSGDKL